MSLFLSLWEILKLVWNAVDILRGCSPAAKYEGESPALRWGGLVLLLSAGCVWFCLPVWGVELCIYICFFFLVLFIILQSYRDRRAGI